MPSAVRVETHHDVGRLERRLEALLRDLKSSDGAFAPALVVVPTRRLLAHLQTTLARAFPALLGVRFQHHGSLAAAIADDAGLPHLMPVGGAARQAILADRIARAGGPLAGYVAAVPGGAGSILATLDELREAGVVPAAARLVPGLSADARALLALYSEYAGALDALRGSGYADRAGRIAALLAHAPGYAARFRLIVHYGAYDLVGMNLDLMRALAAGGAGAPPIVYLAPGHPTAPAFAWARTFWRDALGVEPQPVAPEGPGERLLGESLPLLYDEEACGARTEGVTFFNAQGSADEIGEGILAALADPPAAGGPASIAIMARALEPYAASIAPAARLHGVPVTTSAALPLLRETAAQAATRLLRCLLLDMPAAALFDLIRSGRLRPPSGRDPAQDVDAWERLTREWQVTGGREHLAERLPEWIESPDPTLRDGTDERARERAGRRRKTLLAQARRLRDLVLALEREARALRAASTWRAFSDAARRILEVRLIGFAPEETGADPAVPAIFETIDDLGAVEAAGVRFDKPAMALARLEEGLAAVTLPLDAIGPDGARAGGDAGGVRILDLMQARGLAFDTVVLVGLNAGLLPRPARVDPFLPDADREAIRRALGRPLASKEDALGEEHLLLALALGSARRRLLVSWQRADDDGKARAASLALREIGRVARGAPEIDDLDREARRVSADPLTRARGSVAAHGLLPGAEVGPALALLAGTPERFLRDGAAIGMAPAGQEAALTSGLEFLTALESYDRTEFDALPGGTSPPGSWSPSRLETLGACPQQHFFRDRLRIDEWDDPESPDTIDRRLLGSLAHAVLADLYRDGPPAADTAGGSIAARIADLWRRNAGPIAARLDALYPGLFAIESGAWIESLARFVAHDRETLSGRGGRLEVERRIAGNLALPVFGDLAVDGRVDRLSSDDAGAIVGDYKTGGRLEERVKPINFLKGRRLQMALYALLAETVATPDTVAVEVLGVGPDFDPDDAKSRARLDPKAFGKVRAGILETIDVLARLAASNHFPLDPDSGRCDFCVYRRACRRAHPATIERLERHPALADFHRLRLKKQNTPLLADRAADEAEGEA